MTLRTKLTIALIVLSALATVAIGEVAYLSTERQLTSEIDSSLRDVAAYAATRVGGDGGNRGGGRDAVQLQEVLVQTLSNDGSVLTAADGVTVPVSASDLAIAARGSGSAYRDLQIAGHPYRMLTTATEHGGAVQVLRPLSESRDVLSALRLRIGLAAVAVVLAATACGWLLSRQLTRRLRELAGAATVVAETGRLDVPIGRTGPDETGSDETGQLAAAFARMLAALDRSQLAQRRLVQDAGHELRTPLTSLRTNLDVLARHPHLPIDQQRAVVADLQGETRELTQLVNELVDLTLGGAADAAPEPVALRTVAERVIARAGRRSGRPITLDADDSVAAVVPGQLERALANLLDNAIKFSPDGSPVAVSVAHGRVTVRDAGPGIARGDQPRVFDRFFRSDSARQLPGSGLGLSIVADVVARAGGSVFAGTHPDGGAAVGFVLPATLQPASYPA